LFNKAAGKPQLRHRFDTSGRAAFLNGVLPNPQRLRAAVQNRFIALLKPPFKSSDDYPQIGWGKKPMNTRERLGSRGVNRGVGKMARFEILDSTMAPLGEGPAAGDVLFELGMMYSIGRDVAVDLVAAHKWFNLAAMKGNADAIRLRREVADQMSDAEIGAAQRAARDWLRSNEVPAVPALAAIAAAAPALAA
jgi:uncharacterized protein